ncbi:MAG: type II secretion system protein [Phycisphaerae bacterium]|nr:type II secretion system protein [Phycisphaerae bacterium]
MNRHRSQSGNVIISFRNQNEKKRNAFTLIELLVVIAIISLLVSILLPSLNKAKQLARQVVCLTKLKSIGAANFLHMEDYDGHGSIGVTNGGDHPDGLSAWPTDENPYASMPGGLTHGFYWCETHDDPEYRDTLGEYLGIMNGTGPVPCKSRLPAFCPEFERYPLEGIYTWRTSYAVNGYLGWNMYLGDHVDAMSSTPMMMDGVKWEGEPGSRALPNGFGAGYLPGDEFFLNQATFSHEGTANYLFFDGHSENQVDVGDVDTFRYDLGWTWYGNNQRR